MNKTWQRLGLALLVILLGISCGKDNESPTGPSVDENYIPYKVGNTWTYQVAPVNEAPYTATETVIARINEGGKELAVVKDESTKNPGDFSLTYFELKGDKLLMHRIADYSPDTGDTITFEFETPATWLLLPLKKAQKWIVFKYNGPLTEIPIISSGVQLDSSYMSYSADFTLKGEVLTEETVQAAGKEFEAYKVEFTFEGFITIPNPPTQLPIAGKLGTFWIKPEVGIVRIAFYDLNGEVRELRTLISYTLM